MKTAVLILALLGLLCAAAGSSAESAPALPELPDRLPAEYKKTMHENCGTVEWIQYPSKDYTGDGADVTKRAVVYLPAGYSPENRYDLLVLCHGIGGTESEWGFPNPYCEAKNAVDHLIAEGEIRPLIIVMPNGRSTPNFRDTSFGNMASFYTFGSEIRNDLLPWMDTHYATWGSDTPDDLSASRDHRYMAGLSMGGMQTINIGLCECLDLFSAFGAFSAAPTSYTAAKVASEIKKFEDCPIRFFYSICGLQDGTAYASASQAAKSLPDYTDRVNASNWYWQECDGGHDFNIWNLGLFNFLRILGK